LFARAQHPSLLGAARAARVALAQHKQALAAAAALHRFLAQLATDSPGAAGKPFGGVYVYGARAPGSTATASSSSSSGAVAVAQSALAAVAAAAKGAERVRAQRLATGLTATDVFFEAPTATLVRGLAQLVRDCTSSGTSSTSSSGAVFNARACVFLRYTTKWKLPAKPKEGFLYLFLSKEIYI
jgi:hypothetical protein